MRRIATVQEMREIDRRTIDEAGIPGLLLMENAGLAVVRAVEDMLSGSSQGRVVVFCGGGNNGGDGYAAARHLKNHGYDVLTVSVGEDGSLQGDAGVQQTLSGKCRVPHWRVRRPADLDKIGNACLVVDALLGTGFRGRVDGILAKAVDWINRSGLPVVAVDLPSGLNADNGSCKGLCIHATRTVTLALPKRGCLLPPGRELSGQLTIADISIPAFLVESSAIRTFLLETSDIAAKIPPRPPDAHKGCFGKILVLAGSTGFTGAAVLTSEASLRIGGGLAMLGIPENLNPILEEKTTEVITRPLPQTPEGSLSLKGEKEIRSLLEWADVLALGPGLSMVEETSELIRRVVRASSIPTVVDADGINAFADRTEALEKSRNRPRIFTPHYGELSRLIHVPVDDIAFNRIEIARETAARFGIVLVLKGSPTVVADPKGDVFVNPTGNAGMASAGVGDVLTGMIAGLLGQGSTVCDAALCGVFLHGLAGDVAGEMTGERSMMAGDLLRCVPLALKRLLPGTGSRGQEGSFMSRSCPGGKGHRPA